MQARIPAILCLCLIGHVVLGCSSPRALRSEAQRTIPPPCRLDTGPEAVSSDVGLQHPIRMVATWEPEDSEPPRPSEGPRADADFPEPVASAAVALEEPDLQQLVDTALDQNPTLIRLYREYRAAVARSGYADKLPDPRVGANIFGNPIETAAGSQQANFNFSQTVPWLSRLNAEQQRACLEALAARAEVAAERLRVAAAVRTNWYRLYVLDKQIEIAQTNQSLLKSLIDVANARIATGNATQGDVLLGTVELSKLEERLLTYRRQRRAVEAEINRLAARPADTPVPSPQEIEVGMPEGDAAALHQLAVSLQPEFEAARLRTQATRWGIEVARLRRRPEITLSASYFATDDNRPSSTVVEVGEDPWALGMQVSLPIWHEKYNAMRSEAGWEHLASHDSVEELYLRYDALIAEQLAEAQRAADTAILYETTILPQARQTLAADQEAYANGTVEFDRVIRDYRSLLTLQLGYHTSIGELAIANARLEEAVGAPVPVAPLAD